MTNEQAWDFALGICKVDGGKPSEFFLSLVEKHKRGEVTHDEISKLLFEAYRVT